MTLSTMYLLKTWTGVGWGTVRNVPGIGLAIKNAEHWARRIGLPARIQVGDTVIYEITPAELA